MPHSLFNLQNYQRVRILNKSHTWEIWPIWIIIIYWFYKHSDTKTSKKLILGLFFSWISTFFFFCWKTHFLRWIVLKRSSIILLNVILAFWRMNVWSCNFQGNIIGRYWSGLYMTWPLWKSYNDIKKGNDFLCCSWSYRNWYLGFQNPFEVNAFHESVQLDVGQPIFFESPSLTENMNIK